MASIYVNKPGLLTTVQDPGRWGFQTHGVPVGGPMDSRAHRLANWLVGNPAECATLETTLIGPELTFDGGTTIAMAGAECEVMLDGIASPLNQTLEVRPGSVLRIGPRKRGARTYLAVAGGIDVPPVFRSRATHVLSRMGGIGGRALVAGDRLPIGQSNRPGVRRSSGVVLPDGGARVRVMRGPHDDLFRDDAVETLMRNRYTITTQSDRMGYRLQGPPLERLADGEIISDATAIGSLQVPASGQPILLMADRQTSGGYPKIATLITADLGLAGQLAPGDWLEFALCDWAEALRALIAQEQALLVADLDAAARADRAVFGDAVVEALGEERVVRNAPLDKLTTFRVGGPADWLIDVHDAEELARVLAIAMQNDVPVAVLGGGSNVLIADAGIRGAVLRLCGRAIGQTAPDRVRADAGVTINGLVRWTVNHGLAGLEAWAGTPGTVGGAVFGNAHFEGRLIGDLIARVLVAPRSGATRELTRADMEFGYDSSRLQRSAEILIWAEFVVSPGESAELRDIARRSLAFRKRTQPLDTPSAGCIFQNPDPARDRVPPGIPLSAGALVDRAGLKGRTIGGAQVSPTHGNFIVNTGHATAEQIRDLIRLCRREVSDRFGVELREEIVYLGEFETGLH